MALTPLLITLQPHLLALHMELISDVTLRKRPSLIILSEGHATLLLILYHITLVLFSSLNALRNYLVYLFLICFFCHDIKLLWAGVMSVFYTCAQNSGHHLWQSVKTTEYGL